MVDINHFNDDGKPQTTHVTFPIEDVWQWRDKNKRFFIPPINETNTTVDLDFGVFTNGVAEFSETDTELLVTQGKLHSIIVHIIDVHDKNFIETFGKILKQVLPIIFDAAIGNVVVGPIVNTGDAHADKVGHSALVEAIHHIAQGTAQL